MKIDYKDPDWREWNLEKCDHCRKGISTVLRRFHPKFGTHVVQVEMFIDDLLAQLGDKAKEFVPREKKEDGRETEDNQ